MRRKPPLTHVWRRAFSKRNTRPRLKIEYVSTHDKRAELERAKAAQEEEAEEAVPHVNDESYMSISEGGFFKRPIRYDE